MFLALISFLTVFSSSMAYADSGCDFALEQNVHIKYEDVQRQKAPALEMKSAAEFLLKNQKNWTPEEKISQFLSFLEKQNLALFNMQQVLKEVPHVLLNIEFALYKESRLNLRHSYSVFTSNIAGPSRIEFRHRFWESIEDIAQDVLLWNLMVSEFALHDKHRTLFNPVSYVQGYQNDARRIFVGMTDLLKVLFEQRLLEGSGGLELERNIRKFQVLEQNNQESCQVRNKSACRLWGRWIWQNSLRLFFANSIAISAISLGHNIQKFDMRMANGAVEMATRVVNGEVKPLLKKLGFGAVVASTADNCQVVLEYIEDYKAEAKRINALPHKSDKDLKELSIQMSLAREMKKANPECQ